MTTTKDYLRIDDIMSFIADMASSQGFYGRLYNELLSYKKYDPDAWQEIAAELEGQKFTDTLDIIFYFEC